MDALYKLTVPEIKNLGGRGLLRQYQSSVALAIISCFPNHLFDLWKFPSLQLFWKTTNEDRRFVEYLSDVINIFVLRDWVRLNFIDYGTISQVKYGKILVELIEKRFGSSVVKFILCIFPEVDWKRSCTNLNSLNSPNSLLSTESSSSKYWPLLNRASVSSFSEWILLSKISRIASQLDIRNMEDWYRVSLRHIMHLGSGASSLFRTSDSLINALKTLYPHHNWRAKQFKDNTKKSNQRSLLRNLGRIFSNTEMVEDYYFEATVSFLDPCQLEIDVYIESLSIGFEYQGEQHYENLGFAAKDFFYDMRDEVKIMACDRAGISLLLIPFHFNRNQTTITSYISDMRPDLIEFITVK